MSRGSRQTDKPTFGLRNLQRKVRVEIPALQKFAERAVTVCLESKPHQSTRLRNLSEISVVLISDKRMAELHRRFLGQHGPTDVITFDHGEIFISAETARRHARIFRNSVRREIQLYIVHGLLHLHGFDDRTTAGARKMEVMQQRILQRIGHARPGGND